MSTREKMVADMRGLAEKMLDIATDMDYFGGFDAVLKAHGEEMLMASAIMMSWADEVEAEAVAGHA